MNKTYTVKQVADILGYSTNSIYTFLKEGRIKGVRIGKGRFRISQEELNKLLHLKKSQEFQPATTVSLTPTLIQPAPDTSEFEDIPSLDKHLEETKENISSLFDWFVSLSSIIIGFTMILFIRNSEEFSGAGLSQFLTPIKINLLTAGVGLFTVNIFNRARKNWYFIFNTIIFLSLLVFSAILLSGKDLLGFTIFGLLSFVILFHLFLNLKGILSFALYISLLTILLPIVLIIYPSVTNYSALNLIPSWLPVQVVIVWLLAATAINVVIWILQKKHNTLFLISLLIFNASLIYFAYLYTVQLYWGQALIFILIFLSVIISSFWNKLNLKDEEIRKIIVGIFGELLLIFMAIILVIWVAQNNIRNYVKDELTNKLIYGETLMQSSINSSKQKLITLSKDQILLEAVKKKDSLTLEKITKDVFSYAQNFRRLTIIDNEGNILNSYPEEIVSTESIFSKEDFIQIKSAKNSSLSDLSETEINGVKKEEIFIANPVMDEEENFIGVLVGFLDINSLANRLKLFANSNDSEYFLVLDNRGGIIIKPEEVNGLDDEEIGQLLANRTSGGLENEVVVNINNKLVQIRRNIAGIGWTMALRRSLTNTYNFNDNTNLLINLIIIVTGIITIVWKTAHLKK